MIELLLLLGIPCSLYISVSAVKQVKRYQIRRIGTHVMAKVVQVQMWNDTVVREGTSLIPKAVPLLGGWYYEIAAEWTDAQSGNMYIISSGRKMGLPKYSRGDYLGAYISSKGNYLELF